MASPTSPAAVVPTTADHLIDLLHKTGLFKPDVLNEKLGEFDFPPDAAGAAAVLVRAGLLTGFQSRLLLAGKYRGFKLGVYHIRDQIGRGGMGTVYLAEHATLRRKVALKVLTADGAGQKAGVERFLREARAAAALDHPNVVRVFDVLQSGELHYIVMEYVEGRTLDSLVQGGGAMAPGRAVTYISQAAAGLQHAFEKGFVHRDIKPANLMVTKDGSVKVLDMGLARSVVDDTDRVTELLDDGAVVGTADFISPEQATNQPGVDIRADIYSLGATLFALVAGQPPFAGSTSQVLVQHQIKTPPSLADFDRTIAPGLAAVVARMLAKKPAERYATPADVIAALAPWLPNRDGAQKVMAGLSSAELGRNSGTLQNTLDQVLSGSTRNLPRPDRAGGRRRFGWVAAAVGGATVLAGAAVFIVYGGLEPSPGTRKAGGGAAVKAAVAAAAPREEGRFLMLPLAGPTATATSERPLFLNNAKDWFRLQEWGRRVVQGVPFVIAPPAGGDNNLIMLRGTAGEQARLAPDRVTLPVNRPAVAVHLLGGVAAWGWPFAGKPVDEGDPLGKVVLSVRLRYADGGTEEFPWKNGEQVADWISRHDVPGSEFAFADDLGHQVRYLTVVPTRPGVLAAVELVKGEQPDMTPVVFAVTVETAAPAAARPAAAAPAGPAVYRFDPAALPEFRGTMQGWDQVLYGSVPKPPAGILMSSWKPTATADFSRAAVAGRPALGFAARGADPAAEVVFNLAELGVTLAPGREYLARLDYLTEGDAVAALRAQEAGGTYPTIAETPLAPTGGAWRTAKVRFRRAAGVTRLAVQADRASETGMVHIGRLEVTDPDAPAAVGGPLFRLDPADLTPFRQTVRNRAKLSGTDGTFPAGVGPFAWKPETEAEFAVAPVDGKPALQLTNLRGPASAQLMLNLESPDNGMGMTLTAGTRYELRLTYKTAGGATGRAYTQSTDYKEVAPGEALPDTGGEWRPFVYPFARGAAPLRLLVDLDGTGAGKSLFLRTVELVEAGGPATVATPPAAPALVVGRKVFALDLSGLPTFRGRFADGKPADGVPTNIAGLSWHCWKTASVAEFRGEPTDAGPAVGVTNLNDDTSAQLRMPLDDAPGGVSLTAGKRYVLRVQYRGTNDAAGSLQVRTPDFQTVVRADLPATGGGWAWAELPFARGDDKKLHAVLENASVGEGNTLWLRAAEVSEAR